MGELGLESIEGNCCYFGQREEQDDLVANPEILVGFVVELVTRQLESFPALAEHALFLSFCSNSCH